MKEMQKHYQQDHKAHVGRPKGHTATNNVSEINLLNEIGSETMTKIINVKGAGNDEECECGACHAKFKDKRKYCPECGVEFA